MPHVFSSNLEPCADRTTVEASKSVGARQSWLMRDFVVIFWHKHFLLAWNPAL